MMINGKLAIISVGVTDADPDGQFWVRVQTSTPDQVTEPRLYGPFETEEFANDTADRIAERIRAKLVGEGLPALPVANA